MPAKAGIHDSFCCDEGEVAPTKAKAGWSDFRPRNTSNRKLISAA
jgi:hypothetical protein